MSVEEKQRRISKAKLILETVKKVLNDLKDEEAADMNFHKFLEIINVSSEDYYEALSISIDGQSVILKRCVGERFVNTYHPIFLLNFALPFLVTLVLVQYTCGG